MHIRVIFRILGILLMLFSLTMIPPLFISLIYQDGAHHVFTLTLGLTLVIGALFWFPVRKSHQDLRTRDGFIITTLFWLVPGLVCTLPFMLSTDVNLSFTDAFFESLSGLTTTGATVITHLDDLPKSILWYRQQQQWLGGLGIIVLAVAVLPMLGIGGMQLYRAETPGPMKDTRLTPRITETAKALWYIYLALTIACACGYYVAGMDLFDAVAHSFSTVAIGGFSTHDASIGYFNNVYIEIVAIIFMGVSAVNFALHFYAWRQKSIWHYFADPEVKFFCASLVTVIAVTVLVLVNLNHYPLVQALQYGIFEVVSVATTTGFATANFAEWPSLLPYLLLFCAFAGGCAGSTGGGMKIIRVLLIWKQGVREIQRLIHPNAVIIVKLGKKPIPDRIVAAVWGFFSVYILIYAVTLMALLATGLDFTTAFSAVAACLNNLGPGLGQVAENYGSINSVAKWILCFAMLLGRLEIFTLLVLLTPMFWRR